MPHISLELKGIKYTTRDGTERDDKLYLTQLKDQLIFELGCLDFRKVELELKFVP